MTQCVGRNLLRDLCQTDVLPQDFPRAHPGQGITSRIQEQNALPFSVLESRSQLAQIDRDSPNCTSADRNEPLFAALSEDANQMLVHQHVANADRDPFGNTQACAVAKLENCPITKREGLIERRRREQPLDFRDREHFWKCSPPFWRFKSLAWIADEMAFTEHEAEVTANGRHVSAYRSRSETEILQMVHVGPQRRCAHSLR